MAPKLTVIKTVVNKNGSTATASDFTMHINGSAGTESFAGAASPGTTKTLVAGTYAVTETGALTGDYTESKSADCSGTLAVGDEKTCTITNTRKTGTITVVKDLIPASDTGRFNLRIDGNVVRADAGDGDSSGAISVNTGTHTVSEVAGSIGDSNDYTSSVSCTPGGASASGRGPLDVAVTDGANITCTVTNVKDATVTVIKQASPESSQSFDFEGAGAGIDADYRSRRRRHDGEHEGHDADRGAAGGHEDDHRECPGRLVADRS